MIRKCGLVSIRGIQPFAMLLACNLLILWVNSVATVNAQRINSEPAILSEQKPIIVVGLDDLRPVDSAHLSRTLARNQRQRLVEQVLLNFAGGNVDSDASLGSSRTAFIERGQLDEYESFIESVLNTSNYANHIAARWMPKSIGEQTSQAVPGVAVSGGPASDDADRSFETAYRNWLAQRIQKDLSFKELVQWQLTGDLLPDAMDEQRFATAWARNFPVHSNSTVEEHRLQSWNAFQEVFLGGVANAEIFKKSDPSAFEQLRESFNKSGLVGSPEGSDSNSTMLWWSERQRQQRDAYMRAIASIQQAYSQDIERLRRDDVVAAWYRQRRRDSLVHDGDLIASFGFDEFDSDRLTNLVVGERLGVLVKNARCLRTDNRTVLLPGDGFLECLDISDFSATDEFSFVLEARFTAFDDELIRLVDRDSPVNGRYVFVIDAKRLMFTWSDAATGNMKSVRSMTELPVEHWLTLSVTCDGISGERVVSLFCNGERLAVEEFVPDESLIRQLDVLNVKRDSLQRASNKENVTRDRSSRSLQLGGRVPAGTMLDDFNVFRVALTEVEMLDLCSDYEELPWEEMGAEQRELWIQHYARRIDPQGKYQRESLQYYAANLIDLTKNVARVGVLDGTKLLASDSGIRNRRDAIIRFLFDDPDRRYARIGVSKVTRSLFSEGIDLRIGPDAEASLGEEFCRNDWKVRGLIRRIALSYFFVDYASRSDDASGTKRGNE